MTRKLTPPPDKCPLCCQSFANHYPYYRKKPLSTTDQWQCLGMHLYYQHRICSLHIEPDGTQGRWRKRLESEQRRGTLADFLKGVELIQLVTGGKG